MEPRAARSLLAYALVQTLPVFTLSLWAVTFPLFFLGLFIDSLLLLWFLAVVLAVLLSVRFLRTGGAQVLRTSFRAVWKFAPLIWERDMTCAAWVLERWDAVAKRAGLEEVQRIGGAAGGVVAQRAGVQAMIERRTAPQLVTMYSVPRGLVVEVGVPLGVSPSRYMHVDMWGAAFGVEVQAGIGTAQDGRSVVVLTLLTGGDPLAQMAPLDQPVTVQDWKAVPVGMRQDGTEATLDLRECSGIVVGGLPGAGKSAALSSLLASLVPMDCVQFAVLDGKGGWDWSWLGPRAFLYSRDAENRAAVADHLVSLEREMRRRLDEMPTLRGGSSFWGTGGPTADLPLLVVVVDESQAFLDASLIPKTDKDAQADRQRIEAALASLVRLGRSAGVMVVIATQKPTSDSLPTTIGGNAARAIGFRVKTSPAEVAIFGSGPGEGDPSAQNLPALPGYAVLGSENGTREVVRFYYLPDNVAGGVAHHFQGLTWDPRQQGPATGGDPDGC